MNEQDGKRILGGSLFDKSQADGFIEIHWTNDIDHKAKRVMAFYKVKDANEKVVLSGGINYFSIPPNAVVYIAYHNAIKKGIRKPVNLLIEDDEFIGCGTTQPVFNDKEMAVLNKYEKLIVPYLLK